MKRQILFTDSAIATRIHGTILQEAKFAWLHVERKTLKINCEVYRQNNLQSLIDILVGTGVICDRNVSGFVQKQG